MASAREHREGRDQGGGRARGRLIQEDDGRRGDDAGGDGQSLALAAADAAERKATGQQAAHLRRLAEVGGAQQAAAEALIGAKAGAAPQPAGGTAARAGAAAKGMEK
jgi:hypothetical protein